MQKIFIIVNTGSPLLISYIETYLHYFKFHLLHIVFTYSNEILFKGIKDIIDFVLARKLLKI